MSPRTASRKVFPLFIDSNRAKSSRRSQRASANLRSNRPRWVALIFTHAPVEKARRAAFTARSTSAAVAEGASQIFSPVAGLTTGMLPPSIGGTNLPSMNSLSGGSLGVRERGSVIVLLPGEGAGSNDTIVNWNSRQLAQVEQLEEGSVAEGRGGRQPSAPFRGRLRAMVPAGARRLPVLGVCFGHQLLGFAYGSKVILNPEGREIGSIQVELTPEGRTDRLFANLPQVFWIQTTHQDIVSTLPNGARHLAL